MRVKLFLILCFLLVPVSAEKMNPDKGRILLAGLVTTPGTGVEGVKDALVEIVGSEWSTKTDGRGQFIFTKAPTGDITIQISKEGFQTVTRSATIEKDSLSPPNLLVELLPEGVTETGEGLTGRGTLYIAYSERIVEQTSGPGRQKLDDYDIRRWLLFTDPLSALTNREEPSDADRPRNPITLEKNHVMLYPPSAPGRSTFHGLNGPAYHLAFDRGGQYLYVSGQGSEIKVFDEEADHERVARIVPPHGGVVTSLKRSGDGKWIMATVMSNAPGVLMVDGATAQSQAYLPLDDLDNAVPMDVVSAGVDKLLVTVGAPGQKGKLLVVDPYTGMTQQVIAVGEAPTSVAVTPDKRFAYVVNFKSGNVTVIDLSKGAAVGVLAVGVAPQQCAVTPDGKRLLVSNAGSDTVSVIDVETQRLSGFVRVGSAPYGIAVTPDSKTCYVSNRGDGTVSTVDLGTLKETHVSVPMPHSSPLDVVLRP